MSGIVQWTTERATEENFEETAEFAATKDTRPVLAHKFWIKIKII
jgi:hypothetical protein